ncbi:MAG: hypothetical protein V7L29_07295 [Nostoc sp.]|uniref:hypothetical protein n=1 Tax=Nostoc sp. TaxID=1180 RepID=UPI002FFA9262
MDNDNFSIDNHSFNITYQCFSCGNDSFNIHNHSFNVTYECFSCGNDSLSYGDTCGGKLSLQQFSCI